MQYKIIYYQFYNIIVYIDNFYIYYILIMIYLITKKWKNYFEILKVYKILVISLFFVYNNEKFFLKS